MNGRKKQVEEVYGLQSFPVRRRLSERSGGESIISEKPIFILFIYKLRSWRVHCPGRCGGVCRCLFVLVEFAHRSSDLPAIRGVHTGSVIPDSTANAFQLIRSQPSQYVVASFAGTKYVLTPRDMLTVPRLRDVKVGDVLAFDQIHEIGSREYTIRGNPAIPSDKVKVEATVVEHTKGKMEFIFKKKRRKGYRKTIQHKQPYTRLRIGDIQIPVS